MINANSVFKLSVLIQMFLHQSNWLFNLLFSGSKSKVSKASRNRKRHCQSLKDFYEKKRTIKFPEKFRIDHLLYGPCALEMIESGVITRPGKRDFIKPIFQELVKYTGL